MGEKSANKNGICYSDQGASQPASQHQNRSPKAGQLNFTTTETTTTNSQMWNVLTLPNMTNFIFLCPNARTATCSATFVRERLTTNTRLGTAAPASARNRGEMSESHFAPEEQRSLDKKGVLAFERFSICLTDSLMRDRRAGNFRRVSSVVTCNARLFIPLLSARTIGQQSSSMPSALAVFRKPPQHLTERHFHGREGKVRTNRFARPPVPLSRSRRPIPRSLSLSLSLDG